MGLTTWWNGRRRRWVTTVLGATLGSVALGVGDVVVGGFDGGQLQPLGDHERGHPTGTVWVVNRDRGELAVFDARTGTVLTTMPVGAGAHDICISERAGKAYITAETDNVVTAVDLRTLARESIPVSPLPHHIEPSPDGRTIYVSLASHTTTVGAPRYAAIDTDDHSVTYVTTSSNPAARSHGPQPSLDGDTLYVAHDTGDELTAVDTQTGNIDFSLTPILRAEEVIPTRFGHFLWVSSRGDGTVKRIDLATNTISGFVNVGVQPESVMLTPSERTLAVSLRGTPANVAFVDTTSLTLQALVPIGGAGTAGDLAVMTADGRYVFATFDAGASGTGGVGVIDVRTQTLVDNWPYPGTGRPHGVWYSRRKLRLEP
jgi:DNA-binding beta-propeller fold protein YncE